ncbi:siderophore-iron reductase FhuF [Rhizobium sp. FY34]|uniref:siderophore-iron reductase FhuF n=1 Tax=Rhizobium sp. FY34 TaxID=2562309 RepID=UPI0010C0B4D1|nr:siderophore-iron reductase FhuF [Rhizobium sp. FY34]
MSPDPSACRDIGDLIVAATARRYSAYCRGRHLLQVPDGTEAMACRDLLKESSFNAAIDRLATRYPTTTDRRAIVSVWSLQYLSNLLITPTIALLELQRQLPLALDDMDMLIDRQSGLPRGFRLKHAGHVDGKLDILEGLRPAIRDHLDALIEAMASHSRLGRKTLWTNASAYLSWILAEVARNSNGASNSQARSVTDISHWPDGWRNPMRGLVRVTHGRKGEYIGNRRICCLRYLVPGIGGCGSICPVPDGRLLEVTSVA